MGHWRNFIKKGYTRPNTIHRPDEAAELEGQFRRTNHMITLKGVLCKKAWFFVIRSSSERFEPVFLMSLLLIKRIFVQITDRGQFAVCFNDSI